MVIDGQVYVRSYRGVLGHWFRRARVNPHGFIILSNERPVNVEVVTDEAALVSVTASYHRKCGYSLHVGAMVSREATGATLEVAFARACKEAVDR